MPAHANGLRAEPWYAPYFSQFITLCTHEYRPTLGLIRLQHHHRLWRPSAWGQAAATVLEKLQTTETAHIVEEYVVMPNHIHLLVSFQTCDRRYAHHFITHCKQSLAQAMRAAEPSSGPFWEKSFFVQTIQTSHTHYAFSEALRTHHDQWQYDSLYVPCRPQPTADTSPYWYP